LSLSLTAAFHGIIFFFLATKVFNNLYRILVGIAEGKRPLGRPRCRWEHNITHLRETGCRSMDRNHMAQDRDQWQVFVNTEMNFQVS
jgi:hypothetical protein